MVFFPIWKRYKIDSKCTKQIIPHELHMSKFWARSEKLFKAWEIGSSGTRLLTLRLLKIEVGSLLIGALRIARGFKNYRGTSSLAFIKKKCLLPNEDFYFFFQNTTGFEIWSWIFLHLKKFVFFCRNIVNHLSIN